MRDGLYDEATIRQAAIEQKDEEIASLRAQLADSISQQEHDDAMSCAYRTSEDLRAQLADVESKLKYQRKCTQVNWDEMETAEAERDALREAVAVVHGSWFGRTDMSLDAALIALFAVAPAEEDLASEYADDGIDFSKSPPDLAAPAEEGKT